jgi:hypothetical protein
MNRLLDWLAVSPLASAAKVFVAIVLAFAVADFARSGSIDFANWQTWVIAGLGAAVPVVDWLNPNDDRYGR